MCLSCPPESWLWSQAHLAMVALSTELPLSSGWEGENVSARNGGSILRAQGDWRFLPGNRTTESRLGASSSSDLSSSSRDSLRPPMTQLLHRVKRW